MGYIWRGLAIGAVVLACVGVADARDQVKPEGVARYSLEGIAGLIAGPGTESTTRVSPCQSKDDDFLCEFRVKGNQAVCAGSMHVRTKDFGWLVWVDELRCR